MLPHASRRRPRVPQTCLQCQTPAYIVPPLAAAGVLALLSVSVLTIKNLIHAQSQHPPAQLRFPTLSSLRRHLTRIWPLQLHPSATMPAAAAPSASNRNAENPFQKLDSIRDRAIAQLESERMTASSIVTDEQYRSLPALQRRELLATALQSSSRSASYASVAGSGRQQGAAPVGETAGRAVEKKVALPDDSFWKMAESVNGRAAALGFMLCLAREVMEPGHPSLFEQVVDVVVPIAQSTPPFLVAVCDHLVDLLT